MLLFIKHKRVLLLLFVYVVVTAKGKNREEKLNALGLGRTVSWRKIFDSIFFSKVYYTQVSTGLTILWWLWDEGSPEGNCMWIVQTSNKILLRVEGFSCFILLASHNLISFSRFNYIYICIILQWSFVSIDGWLVVLLKLLHTYICTCRLDYC